VALSLELPSLRTLLGGSAFGRLASSCGPLRISRGTISIAPRNDFDVVGSYTMFGKGNSPTRAAAASKAKAFRSAFIGPAVNPTCCRRTCLWRMNIAISKMRGNNRSRLQTGPLQCCIAPRVNPLSCVYDLRDDRCVRWC